MAIESLIPKFHFTRVLKSEANTKTVALLGQIEGQDAILSLEKCHFNMASLDTIPTQISDLSTDATNDIYQWGVGTLISSLPEYPDVKASLIYPATETHIMKYDTQKFHVVKETPEIYKNAVVPYIEKMVGDRLQWVRNILYEGAEAERVAYREEGDNGFVLLPDMKWDGINIEQLYLVLIVNRKDIRSLRDLNNSHSEYLYGLLQKVREVVPQKYGIAGDQLRLFVHYQPSYYHFHIHVVNVEHPGLGDGIAAGKAILLEEVIEQLNWLGEEGFEKKTITYVLGENHKLWSAIKTTL
jgi:m7GpppX diphosphatase